MLDAVIIGTGPAGVSAALNLKIHNKDFVWLGSKNLSDKISKAEIISNYPGFTAVTGEELLSAFKNQINNMGIEITEQMVHSVMKMGDGYAVMAGSEFYETKTLLLATGTAAGNTLAGESSLVGKGVSYCATCDGNLYKGKTIAILCGNRRFEHEAVYLAELAEKVYFFPQYQEISEIGENVEIRKEEIEKIEGEKRVSGIRLKGGSILAVDGIFCLRDAVALSTLLPDITVENGHILVDRKMATNLPGVFAAGDCTGAPYQYTKAVGEGNVAAHSMIEQCAKKF